jgi:WD40 repeat protein
LDAVCFQQNGKDLWTVGKDLALRTWDGATGLLAGNSRSGLPGNNPAFTTNGKLLMHDNNKAWLLDPATGRVLFETPGSNAAISVDAKKMAALSEQGFISVYDLSSGDRLGPKKGSVVPRTGMLGFTDDGLSLVCKNDSFVWVIDAITGVEKKSWSLEKAKVLDKGTDKAGAIVSVVLSPDGTTVALGLAIRHKADGAQSEAQAGRIMILETMTGRLVQQTDVENGQNDIQTLAFSSDGKRLAASGRQKIRVWQVGSEKAAWQFEGHRGPVKSLAFSHDGKRLASASEDSTVLVWDLAK